jgi:peroxiredoxin
VSISQQTVTENAKVYAQLKLGFPILSDRGGRLAQLFGVRWCIPELLCDIHRKSGIDLPLLNGDQSWTLPIPARFILDRAGVIAYSKINPGQSGGSPPRDVLPVLSEPQARRRQRDISKAASIPAAAQMFALRLACPRCDLFWS